MKSLVVRAGVLFVAACAPAPQEAKQVVETPAPEAAVEVAESYPDPDEEVAQEVQGMMADFHTVHQEDADTDSVCLDFTSGEQLYDVDFFVDRTEEGLVVADHYLHKIDGEAVEERCAGDHPLGWESTPLQRLAGGEVAC